MNKEKIKTPKDLAEVILAKLILKSNFNIEEFIEESIKLAKEKNVFHQSSNKCRDYSRAKQKMSNIINKGL